VSEMVCWLAVVVVLLEDYAVLWTWYLYLILQRACICSDDDVPRRDSSEFLRHCFQ
jgi:hypothetical protein